MTYSNFNWLDWEEKILPPFNEDRGMCRTCKHGEYWHLKESPSCDYRFPDCKISAPIQDISYIREILVPRVNKFPICSCLEYVPGNNLDYLEWKGAKINNEI